MLTNLLLAVSILIGIWLVSLTIAWAINRSELKHIYGDAPYNWRIYGWIFTYIPYLKQLQSEREN